MIADLLIDSTGALIRRRSGISAPDPFIYIREENGISTVFFDSREYDVQKNALDRKGNVVAIERLEPYIDAGSTRPGLFSSSEKALLEILYTRNVTEVFVPETMPYGYVSMLQQSGIRVQIKDFSSELTYKTEEEILLMKGMQKHVDEVFAYVKSIFEQSSIEGSELRWKGDILSSETMRFEIESFLLARGLRCPDGVVVSCGVQASQPHNMGSGPLAPHQAIIIDIFPQDPSTGYYADMTRTFCKGTPTQELISLYESVKKAQQAALTKVQVGVLCTDVHATVVASFLEDGHNVSTEKGFMHGTGHGLGLGLHENPRFNANFAIPVEKGMVMTVEPGLYYPEIGGVRIEDVVVVHEDGHVENITCFEKELTIS